MWNLIFKSFKSVNFFKNIPYQVQLLVKIDQGIWRGSAMGISEVGMIQASQDTPVW